MEIVLKSLASAVITAIILLIAKFSGPKLAGAIGGIPIVFAISYVLLTLGGVKTYRAIFWLVEFTGLLRQYFLALFLFILTPNSPTAIG